LPLATKKLSDIKFVNYVNFMKLTELKTIKIFWFGYENIGKAPRISYASAKVKANKINLKQTTFCPFGF